MAAAALLGAGTGLSALLRTRGQNRKDSAESEKTEAEAESARVNAYAALWERVNKITADYDARMEELRAQLNSDIEAKDIRLRRLESDVVSLKRSLGEWRSYAMGLFDMLVKLGQTPPKPPDTGPLK